MADAGFITAVHGAKNDADRKFHCFGKQSQDIWWPAINTDIRNFGQYEKGKEKGGKKYI